MIGFLAFGIVLTVLGAIFASPALWFGVGVLGALALHRIFQHESRVYAVHRDASRELALDSLKRDRADRRYVA